MTTKLKIPKGWRKLRKGTLLVATDKMYINELPEFGWSPIAVAGRRAHIDLANADHYIRRIKKPVKRRGKK